MYEYPVHIKWENNAQSMGIPEEHWNNPVVQEYLQLLTRVENLQVDLEDATRSLRGVIPDVRFGVPEDAPPLVGLSPWTRSLGEKFSAAELMLRGMSLMLRHGVGRSQPADPIGYIVGTIGNAIGMYGLQIVTKAEASQ